MDKLFDFNFMIKSIPQLIAYIPVTIWLTVVSMLLGLIVGLFTALVRIYKVPIFKQLSVIYISFIRGTPLLVQLFLTYYGIPKFLFFFQNQYGWFQNVNINVIPPEVFAVLAFTSNLGAYLSETIRSAIESVDRGQFEAASSIGMTQTQIMIKIILPQALLVALPNIGNMMISTVKDTSLVFTIAITDIMGEAKVIGARALAYFEVYVGVSLIYWLICIVLERILILLENRLKKHERSVVR
jgi:L-cystine transport system permease protein